VYHGKTADWAQMLFGVVSGVDRGMGTLDGVVIVEWEMAVLGVSVGRPIVTNGDGDALLPNYFGEDLFNCEILYYTCRVFYHLRFYDHSCLCGLSSLR